MKKLASGLACFGLVALASVTGCNLFGGGGDDTSCCIEPQPWYIDLAVPVSSTDLASFGSDLATPPTPSRDDLGTTGTLSTCEACLNIGCGTQVSACETDANCLATLSCMVTDQCFASDPSSSAFGTCTDTCTAGESLSLSQTNAVVGELNAISACYGYCKTACNGG